ncbi:MAG TPA: MerC domain-containing protein [Nitrospiraceae bacterium]|nr:MerC domain-containing protein [Nitrospiraceae bacterium]
MPEPSKATPRFGRLAATCTVLSIAACYGTLATVSVLSLLGVTLVIHKGVWAGAISLFALLALFGVALGYRVHRGIAPLVFAALGAGAILWAMFGSYSRVVELMGFAGLITGSIWDWRLKQRSNKAP